MSSLSLTQRDHREITQHLAPLNNLELTNVGLRLGLRYPTLKKMNQESLLNDMVHAWLRRDDDVAEVAEEPTWEALSTALEDCGHNGVALEIKKTALYTSIWTAELQGKRCHNNKLTSELEIPRKIMEEHESYHQAITGKEAEKRLKRCTGDGGHGYLTRFSEMQDRYVLSVYQREPNNVAKHFEIISCFEPVSKRIKLDGGETEVIERITYNILGKDEEFDGLGEMLAHYEENRLDPSLRSIGRCITEKEYLEAIKNDQTMSWSCTIL